MRKRKGPQSPDNGAQAPIPPLADPIEAVERIVPRRQLLFEDGDVIITQMPGSYSFGRRQHHYELRVRGIGAVPGRFVGFEHACAAGEELAARQGVRLYYVESEQHTPSLLKDYRPSR